jgi:hypothetical protein
MPKSLACHRKGHVDVAQIVKRSKKEDLQMRKKSRFSASSGDKYLALLAYKLGSSSVAFGSMAEFHWTTAQIGGALPEYLLIHVQRILLFGPAPDCLLIFFGW